ncbi:Hypothetical protein PBC10988_23740 [Planctomycetales bacterium 10988]|nr:Hypothetical protein PBC10988_23740 [Planctomycetales bacterium 10988]
MSGLSRYETFNVIGQNDYATVYKGYDTSTKREVAVMELLERFHSNPQQWETIWKTVLDRVDLKHDYMVIVHDVDKERRWIILEMMRGNLATKVAKGPLSPAVVRFVLRRCLEALAFLHQHERRHGDVKPGNMLYDREGYVKLSFSPGLIMGDQVPRPENVQGQKYLAPELLKTDFGEIGAGVDLYRMGFSALEALVGPAITNYVQGTKPDSPNPGLAWMRFHSSTQDHFPPLKEMIPNIPADLETVISRLLEKQVSARYRSAEEALADLDSEAQEARIDPSSETSAGPYTGPHVMEAEESRPQRDEDLVNLQQEKKDSSRPAVIHKTPPKQPSVKKSSSTTTTGWIKQQVNKPPVQYSLIGGILLIILLLLLLNFLWIPGSGEVAKRDVQFISEPSGAGLYVKLPNGEMKSLKHKTPTTLQLTPGKSNTFVFQLAGYKPEELPVKVEPGSESVSKKVTLSRLPREVQIDSEPGGATIYLNGEKQSVLTDNKLALEVGKEYDLRLVKEGYQDHTSTFEIPEGEGIYALDPIQLKEAEQVASNDPVEPPMETPKEDPPKEDPPPKKDPPKGTLPAGLVGLGKILENPAVPEIVGVEKVNTKLTGNQLPIEMGLIPAGPFIYGTSEERYNGELEQQEKTIEIPYYISVYEVTNAQYRIFADEVGEGVAGSSWQQLITGNEADFDNYPVANVSHQQAKAFCQWVMDTGRLPSEIEWERAFRGTDGRLYPWGNEEPNQVRANIPFPDLGTDVNSYKPMDVDTLINGQTIETWIRNGEPIGLRHGIGNVSEWCEGFYTPGWEETEETQGVGSRPVIRGTSFQYPLYFSGNSEIRLTWRANRELSGGNDIGFRLVIPINLSSEEALQSADED